MIKKDIEKIIVMKSISVMISNNIDNIDSITNDTLIDIYEQIYNNSKKIKEIDGYKPIVYPAYDTKKMSLLRKLDTFGKSIPFYYTIRPFLKNKFSHIKQIRYININDIIGKKLDDKDFVINLYNVILNREPIESDIKNCRELLETRKYNRIDLILLISESQEAKNNNIEIRGLKIKQYINKIAKLFKSR